MTATRRALIVVDVQNEYFDGILQVQYPPRDETLGNITGPWTSQSSSTCRWSCCKHEFPEGAPVFAVNSRAGLSTPRSSVA